MTERRLEVDPAEFARLFQGEPSSAASASGRVNLIGEHTDYNGGFVLPAVIPQRTRVLLRLRPPAHGQPHGRGTVRAASAQLPELGAVEYELGAESRRGGFVDYVQGVTWALRQAGHGAKLCGFDLYIDSDVPLGGGLSSSAALEVALLRALRAGLGLPIDDVTLARLGQQAENELVGVPSGIMDQMAVSLCTPGTALFLDTRALHAEAVPLPPSLEIGVIHSGLAHQLAHGDYKTRRRECEEAAALLGVRYLCELPCTAAGMARLAELPEPQRRRARHVVSENARVIETVAALRAPTSPQLGERLGALLLASHASLRDDFEVSLPQIDRLVELAVEETDVFGCRLTGGGFGGSVVLLARAGAGRSAAERIAARYQAATGCTPQVLLPL